jgi:hypothetical protein
MSPKIESRYALIANLLSRDDFDLDRAIKTVETLIDFIFREEDRPEAKVSHLKAVPSNDEAE